jgi:hypothetical protein
MVQLAQHAEASSPELVGHAVAERALRLSDDRHRIATPDCLLRRT